MSKGTAWDAMLARAKGALSREQVEGVVRAYLDSWTQADVEARAALFAEDASFADPVGAPELVGREAIRGFWAKVAAGPFRMMPELHRLIVTGDHALAIFTMNLVHEGQKKAAIEIFETFELNAEGKIRRLGPYWDRSCVHSALDAQS